MSIVLGKDVNLYIVNNGVAQVIMCAKNGALTTTTEIGERTTVTSGIWKEYKALALSASLKADGDVFFMNGLSVTDLVQMQFNLLSLAWTFEQIDTSGNSRTYTGTAVIENIDQGGEVNSPATFSVSLIVDGAITIS